MLLNVGVLLLCLVVILVFKGIVANKTAEFMDEFSPEEGSGEGTGAEAEAAALALTVGVAQQLLHEAQSAGDQTARILR